ncbi:hypothetical protein [Silicimonas algicola]|uniref:hypothetical protein n=1 Tax=Silicimonas algicola TaxID=1826607 RepID=UPI000D6D6567|nr:hypothetical protein [Silicimonas algicola]
MQLDYVAAWERGGLLILGFVCRRSKLSPNPIEFLLTDTFGVKEITDLTLPSYAFAVVKNLVLGGDVAPTASLENSRPIVLSRLDAGQGAGLGPGQFQSPHSIAQDSAGDLYVGDFVDADWAAVIPEVGKPDRPRRFQKFRRCRS